MLRGVMRPARLAAPVRSLRQFRELYARDLRHANAQARRDLARWPALQPHGPRLLPRLGDDQILRLDAIRASHSDWRPLSPAARIALWPRLIALMERADGDEERNMYLAVAQHFGLLE